MSHADVVARILGERVAEEKRAAETKRKTIAAGPPAGSGISAKAWADWYRYGFVVCPGERRELVCRSEACDYGKRCAKMATKGLHGSGEAMRHRSRPMCSATTRAGGKCQMRVEAGKRRCRLHGGLSTGPKTAEGRERIAAAQRRRWASRKPRNYGTDTRNEAGLE